ncbi:hypothetical protein, partial [Sinorhizobium meliloti]|uniref:hypothetical protein n=1 Tax=Rhizobium meliloti TaxID=382 RepID=UPI001AECA0E5
AGLQRVSQVSSPAGPLRNPAFLAGQETLPQPPGAALGRFAALAVPARRRMDGDRRQAAKAAAQNRRRSS